MVSDDVLEEPDAGLNILSSIDHIIITNVHLLYICADSFFGELCHLVYKGKTLLASTNFFQNNQMLVKGMNFHVTIH